MIPEKLKSGDEIRIIAPSSSFGIISKENRDLAVKKIEELGLKISYSKNIEEVDEFDSSSIESRVSDLHDAFRDENVKAILVAIGGFNVNQILKYLDYDLIKNNPKILCGFSDITALSNAIYKKTGLITYSGPNFANFSMKKGNGYIIEYFKKCFFEGESYEIKASKEWSDDKWHLDQENRNFIKNDGAIIINQGKAEGKIIGGNLCTLNLLQGTGFMPDLKDSILFLEDDNIVGELFFKEFDRNFQSLIQQEGFSGVRGIVLGRFQRSANMENENITKLIKSKRELKDIPVVANLDFGHTTPIITFPIGGAVRILADKDKISLEILEH